MIIDESESLMKYISERKVNNTIDLNQKLYETINYRTVYNSKGNYK
jgi:hypothetical protein